MVVVETWWQSSPGDEGMLKEHAEPLSPGLALCAGCHSRIQDRFYLLAVDRQWHLGCLTCCECKIPLDSELTCFARHGNIYCKDDYYSYFGCKISSLKIQRRQAALEEVKFSVLAVAPFSDLLPIQHFVSKIPNLSIYWTFFADSGSIFLNLYRPLSPPKARCLAYVTWSLKLPWGTPRCLTSDNDESLPILGICCLSLRYERIQFKTFGLKPLQFVQPPECHD
ncbi:LIM/homeobox protein Lhx2 [Homalodisca vitripennis]|nr:LIM/homeobox protein Lhx2 [Homalodisca vitripennis]